MKIQLEKLQASIEESINQRKKATEAAKNKLVPKKTYNPRDFMIKPTAVDLMLMKEYDNNVYQGD